MKCLNCNKENIENFEYCAFCNAKLKDIEMHPNYAETSKNIIEISNKTGMRTAIKKKAKEKNKTNIILYFILIFCIGILLSLIFFEINITYTKIFLIVFSFYILFAYITNFGAITACIELCRENNVELTNILTYSFKNIKGVIRNVIVNTIFAICVFLLLLFSILFPIIGIIISFIFAIYMFPVILIFNFMQCDKKSEDVKLIEGFIKAMKLCKGKRTFFYGLIFSFAPWFLLGSSLLALATLIFILSVIKGDLIINYILFSSLYILGILLFVIVFLWTVPYKMISLANFYRILINEEEFNSTKRDFSSLVTIPVGIIIYIFLIHLFLCICGLIKLMYTPSLIDNTSSNDTEISYKV